MTFMFFGKFQTASTVSFDRNLRSAARTRARHPWPWNFAGYRYV